MELLEFTQKIKKLFEVNDIKDLPQRILDIGFTDRIYSGYLEIVGDLNKDWIKHLFQYYQADRNEKKQDFTPQCLCKLVSKLTGKTHITYDCCAGTGALTIEKAKEYPEATFYCEELDTTAIPFLLFNLAVRGISAYVANRNALSGEIVGKCYKVNKDRTVKEITPADLPTVFDTAISNPPYNIGWEPPMGFEAALDERFNKCEIPKKNNANYAFILNCIGRADKISLILPNCVLKDDLSTEIRKYLIQNNLLESVILLPDKMFEITSISVCILTFNKHKKDDIIQFLDYRQRYSTETREQNGQYGGATHENRTYKKEYKIITDEQIAEMLNFIGTHAEMIEVTKGVKGEEVLAHKDCSFSPADWVGYDYEKTEPRRSYEAICNDLNNIIRLKNVLKVTVNETLVKKYGFTDLADLLMESQKNSREMSAQLKSLGLGIDIITENCFALSKNKNEFKIENTDKDILSHIIICLLSSLKEHWYFLNEQENIYLKELKNALLPDLMSGKLEIK